jgi:ribosomal protein S27AE
MTMAQGPMRCPECGATMNQHAAKVVYGSHGAQTDPELGGVLEEMHACPRCGYVASRPAT